MFFGEKAEQLDKVLLESLEDALVVLSRANVLFKASHTLRNVMLGKSTTLSIVMVHVAHAELRLKAHGAREELHQLSQNILVVGHLRVIHKHDSIGFFLNSRPAFLVAEVTGNVPQLQVQFTEASH